MRTEFVKMHGLGNDFVVLDARESALPELSHLQIAALADRHQGIGFDQLIRLEPSERADLTMRVFNADGGEVEACGNASRAVGVLVGQQVAIETKGGVITARPDDRGAEVAMGAPRFDWQDIPLAHAMDTADLPLGWEDLERPGAVNVGNPHVVFFVDDPAKVPLETLGPLIENDPVFPQRINVNVARIDSRKAITLRVWERGAGLTRACGTGACATAAVAMRRGLVGNTVAVTLPGGTLTIRQDEDGGLHMAGPATESFRGSFSLEAEG